MRWSLPMLAFAFSACFQYDDGPRRWDTEPPDEGDTDTDTDTDTDGDCDTDTGPDPVTATCYDVQTGVVAEGEVVRLTDMVATSGLSLDGFHFYVQDPGGGEFHGLTVYAPSHEVTVAVGDQLTVTGRAAEYFDLTELRVADAAEVTATGSAEVTAAVLDEVPESWEPWESCLITLLDVEILEKSRYGEHITNWGVAIDDQFLSCPCEVPASFASVTGLLNYTYDAWKLEPRAEDDFVP